jgi:hypothetical protein
MRMWWTTTTNAALTTGLRSAFMTRVLAEETLHQGERGESRPPSQRATASAWVRTWSFL